MTIIIVLGVVGAIVLVLGFCYFLIPGLRRREASERVKTREENAADEVESMVVNDSVHRGPSGATEEAIDSIQENVEEEASRMGINLSAYESYLIALERVLFSRYRS